ncbi:MAG: substrate-binding domain-containing protein [Rhizobiales bacterium]|nr:substrate-binding domain-containing protein [Hyphomicrobiales bacterium]
MRAILFALAALAAAPTLAQDMTPTAVWGEGRNLLRVATGSPGELGLLEALATDFAKKSDARIVWFRAGSGAAMKLLQERKVDMALAHAPAAERKAVADGWATGRRLFGSNEFWIVGPKSDPAKIAGLDAVEAFRKLAASGAKTVTRADNSGTHQKEMEIWKAAGLAPAGDWYIPTRDFMAASLQRAEKEGAYFLTDSSTFIAERANTPGLTILVKGGQVLVNPYHTLRLTQPTEGSETAKAFADYLLSAETQATLRGFGKARYGEAMYNDAEASRAKWPADQ